MQLNVKFVTELREDHVDDDSLLCRAICYFDRCMSVGHDQDSGATKLEIENFKCNRILRDSKNETDPFYLYHGEYGGDYLPTANEEV